MHYSLFFIFFLLIFNTLVAQVKDSSATDSSHTLLPLYEAEPVIVNASRSTQPLLQTPFSAETIELQEINTFQKRIALDELLQQVPGLFVNNRQNFALGNRISIRGIGARSSFGVRGIKILLDDIPLTMADGQSQLNNLDLSSAAKIEIIKGASSSLYGNSAGGLIQINTQEIEDTLFAAPEMMLGSYDLRRLQAKLSAQYNQSNYFVNINTFNSSGFRENSAVKSSNINALSRHRISDKLKLSSVVNFYDSPFALNPSSLSKEQIKLDRTASRYFIKQQGSGEKTRQVQAGATLQYTISDSQQLKLTVYGIGRTLKNPIPSRIIELDRLAGGFRMAYNNDMSIGNQKLIWTGGFDAEIQSDKRQEFANEGLAADLVGNIKAADVLDKVRYGNELQNQDEQVYSLGPFFNIALSLSDKWIINFGGRYDYYNFAIDDNFLADSSDDSGDIVMNQLSPMAGIVYMFQPAQSLFFNYSTAFQTPTTAELGNTTDGRGLNPDLKPENMHSFELGIKGILMDYDIYYQAVLYYFEIQRMLVPYQDNLSEEVYYRNAGHAQNSGLEIALDWHINDRLKLLFASSFMHFIFTDYAISDPQSTSGELINLADNKVPGVAPVTVHTGISYNHPSRFYMQVQVNWIDKYFANDFNGAPPGDNAKKSNYINNDALTFNLNMGRSWTFKHFDMQLFMGLDNLFDYRYNSSIVPNAVNANFFEPAPGRTWYAGLRLAL